MDLRVIESFVQVARHGGFAAAARSLSISPAAVSRNVTSLERRLQVQLFDRSTRQVQLTPEGARRLERCASAIEVLTECMAPTARQQPCSTLRVVAPPAFSRTHLLPLLPAFITAHPDVKLQLVLRDLVSAIPPGNFDVVISPDFLPGGGYVGRPLLPVTLLVCASPAYLLLHGAPGCLADLGAHRLIGVRSDVAERAAAWEFRQDDGIALQLGIEPALLVGDPETACAAALLGLGLAQLGSDLALPHIAALRLETALAGFTHETRGLHVSWAPGRRMRGTIADFVRHLVDHFSARADLVVTPVCRIAC